MKDVETLLKQSGSAKPRRGLSADFTSKITNYLVAHPRKSRFARFTEVHIMKWFTKPAIALSALVFAIVAGGASYAAVGGWPSVVALFGGQQTLPGGDRIVKVDTKNCTYINAFTVTGTDIKNQLFYRIKSGSKLTNDQVVELALGNCFAEEQAKFDVSVIQSVLDANPLNKDRVVGGYADAVVTAITDSSISLEFEMPVGYTLEKANQTFTHIAPDVLVYQSPNKLTWSDIKVGDHVAYSYRASGEALTKSETTAPTRINPDEQVIVMINKNTPEYSTALKYQKYNGGEFEQVIPCTGGDNGYCNYEQYFNNK